jgi:hypothetical protein
MKAMRFWKWVLFMPTLAPAQVFFTNSFDTPVNTRDTTAWVDSTWYIDRWKPRAFESLSYLGGNRLHVRIDTLDAAIHRPSNGGYNNYFYNTQGRRYNLQNRVNSSIGADLYVPLDWKTHHRRADIWARMVDSLSTGNQESSARYPTMGFANLTGTNPTIRVWDPSLGLWVTIKDSTNISFDSWYSLRIDFVSTGFNFYLNGVQVYSASGLSGTNMMRTFLVQAYNFGDTTMPASHGTYALESYDVYWDNFAAQPVSILPIQIAWLTAVAVDQRAVRVDWSTASETNNYGFEVEKSQNDTSGFQTVPNSFVPGHGTTLQSESYSFVDISAGTGIWYYRLKQIDLDGTVHSTDPVRVELLTGVHDQSVPTTSKLDQNYPNPFNPTSDIGYQISDIRNVRLAIYDLLGREVAVLVNERQSPGSYSVRFNANGLASGVYLYTLTAGDFVSTRRLVLCK